LTFVCENGQLVGMTFDKVKSVYEDGKRRLVSTGEEPVYVEADDVVIAVGQELSFPWIEKSTGIEFNKWGEPIVDKITFQSTNPNVFFGGDAASPIVLDQNGYS